MQDIADKILRLQSRLDMLGTSASRELSKVISDLQKEITAIVAQLAPLQYQKDVLSAQKEVRAAIKEAYSHIETILDDYQVVSAEVSSSVQLGLFVIGEEALSYIKDLDIDKVVLDAGKRVFPGQKGASLTVAEIIDRFYDNGYKSLQNIMVRGYTEGLSVTRIIALIRESTGLQKRQAEAIARTAILAAGNEARDNVASSLGVDKVIWMATLDSKTCPYCQGQDGKCRDYNKAQKPPAHVNCRCVSLYLPPGTSCSEMRGDLSRVQRGEDGKSRPLPKYQNYGEWIKTQPVSFQEEVLGKARSKDLRDGKVTFNKMYTNTGSRKTIAELQKHYGG